LEHDKDLVFLTNNMDLKASEIAFLYKKHWEIELFFKWMKQHLKIRSFEIRSGDAFVVVDHRDLEYLVRYSIEEQDVLGSELGIISYNETSMKGIVASGITTISTDFEQMGRTIANMILNHQKLKLDNPFVMNIRNSFLLNLKLN